VNRRKLTENARERKRRIFPVVDIDLEFAFPGGALDRNREVGRGEVAALPRGGASTTDLDRSTCPCRTALPSRAPWRIRCSVDRELQWK